MVQNSSSTPSTPSLFDLCVRIVGSRITKYDPRTIGSLRSKIQDKIAKYLTHHADHKLQPFIPFYLPKLSNYSFKVLTPLDIEMTLGGLQGNTDLRKLKIMVNSKIKYNPEVKTAGLSICQFLQTNTSLTSLSLRGSDLWRANVPELLATFSKLPKLRSLNLQDVALNNPAPETDETPVLKQSIDIIKTRQIAHLNLSGLFFTDDLLNALLTAIGCSTSLTSVSLSNNGFTVFRFAETSACLSSNTHLKKLDISWIEGCSAKDNAAVIQNLIPFINNNTRLTELNLNHIGCLTDAGIEHLNLIDTRKRPLILSFKGQSLSEEQILRLMDLKKLKVVY